MFYHHHMKNIVHASVWILFEPIWKFISGIPPALYCSPPKRNIGTTRLTKRKGKRKNQQRMTIRERFVLHFLCKKAACKSQSKTLTDDASGAGGVPEFDTGCSPWSGFPAPARLISLVKADCVQCEGHGVRLVLWWVSLLNPLRLIDWWHKITSCWFVCFFNLAS